MSSEMFLNELNLDTHSSSVKKLMDKMQYLTQIQSAVFQQIKKGKSKIFIESPLKIGKSFLYFMFLLK